MLGVWKVSYQRKKKKKNGKRFLVLVLVKSASPPRTSLLYHPSLSLLIPLFNQIHEIIHRDQNKRQSNRIKMKLLLI